MWKTLIKIANAAFFPVPVLNTDRQTQYNIQQISEKNPKYKVNKWENTIKVNYSVEFNARVY